MLPCGYLKILVLIILFVSITLQLPIKKNRKKAASNNFKQNRLRCQMPYAKDHYQIGPWSKHKLTYKLGNITEIAPKSTLQKIIKNAINEWTDKIDLTISESNNNHTDFTIYSKVIDERYNILGYAYFPEVGDIVFDVNETWSFEFSTSYYQINFQWVLVHELGHSLGLSHDENDITSIMYPFYSDKVTKPNANDLRRLENFYGPKKCLSIKIDNMFTLPNNQLVIVINKLYWLIDNDVKTGPYNLRTLFPYMPDIKFDAILVLPSKTFVFSGKKFYKYSKEKLIVKTIKTGFGDIPTSMDALFLTPENELYVFKESKYYILDFKEKFGENIKVGKESIVDTFHGIPNNIEQSALVKDKIYFVKNNKYYIVDYNSKKVEQEGNLDDLICVSSLEES